MYTYFKRELMQAIWKLLLDDDIVEAYKNGVLIHCADSITRRVFPRFFSYSANYPEKYVSHNDCWYLLTLLYSQSRVLLACVKFLGECPCPCCLVKKADLLDVGKSGDMVTRMTQTQVNNKAYQSLIRKARQAIFKRKGLSSKAGSNLLKDASLVPIQVCHSLFVIHWTSCSYSPIPECIFRASLIQGHFV